MPVGSKDYELRIQLYMYTDFTDFINSSYSPPNFLYSFLTKQEKVQLSEMITIAFYSFPYKIFRKRQYKLHF